MSKDLSAKYYQNSKERLHRKSRQKYQSLSEEEKNKKREYGRERYKNLTEDEKQRLYEYRRRYYEIRKSKN